MGIAIECRRLDKLEEAITKSDNVQGTLSYCINVSHSFVNLREYRHEVSDLINLLICQPKSITLFSWMRMLRVDSHLSCFINPIGSSSSCQSISEAALSRLFEHLSVSYVLG